MLRVENIRIPVGAADEEILAACARALQTPPAAIQKMRILRKALDVRDKRRLEHVYTAAIEVDDEAAVLGRADTARVKHFQPVAYQPPEPGQTPLQHRPVVVGAGPAGLFAAYLLAEQGYAPIVLERGRPVRERIRDVEAFDAGGPLDVESNYLFGEGGAGTFSDGKLTCRVDGPDVDRTLEILAAHKGKPSILYEARPHLGSNRLPAVVKALRRSIERLGGEFQFSCRLERVETTDGRLTSLLTSRGRIDADLCVVAIGHSARDTLSMLLASGVAMAPKPFQFGVRIEQPQATVNAVRYGTSPAAALLGPADYSLQCRYGERDLFTFCMCAGGYVMPSVSQAGHFCTNGMSRSAHESPYANSGLMMTVDPRPFLGAGYGDDNLAGMRFQGEVERLANRLTGEDYLSPIQWVSDFLADRPSKGRVPSSYARGAKNIELASFLPRDLVTLLKAGLPMLNERWKGRFLAGATLVGPESRGSCPVRICRDVTSRESTSLPGVYPIGEGAGYAGGIVSAAVDGLRTAKAIIGRYRRPGQ